MIYQILVKTGSKKGPLIVETPTSLTVYLRERPIDGQANAALIKLLAKHFRVPQSQIRLKSGGRSHLKLIKILETP